MNSGHYKMLQLSLSFPSNQESDEKGYHDAKIDTNADNVPPETFFEASDAFQTVGVFTNETPCLLSSLPVRWDEDTQSSSQILTTICMSASMGTTSKWRRLVKSKDDRQG